jgi:hypothetical protein
MLCTAHTGYLCVLCGSQNKQRLFPYTTLTGLYNRDGVCLLRGTGWVFKYVVPISGKQETCEGCISSGVYSSAGCHNQQNYSVYYTCPPHHSKQQYTTITSHYIIPDALPQQTAHVLLCSSRVGFNDKILHMSPRRSSDAYLFACKEVKSWNVKVILFRHISHYAEICCIPPEQQSSVNAATRKISLQHSSYCVYSTAFGNKTVTEYRHTVNSHIFV